jgi:hypothetical protein
MRTGEGEDVRKVGPGEKIWTPGNRRSISGGDDEMITEHLCAAEVAITPDTRFIKHIHSIHSKRRIGRRGLMAFFLVIYV